MVNGFHRISEMDLRLCLIFALTLMPWTYGQELTLDRDVSVESGQQPLCGVLRCEEATTAFAAPDDCQKKGKISFQSISSIKIFHRALNSPKRTEIALTKDVPSINGAAYGFTVNGYLEIGGASMRIDLFKEKNCLSEFTCEIQGVDEAGKEVISSVTLLPQPAQAGGGNQASSGGLMSAVSLQLLNQVQQLNTKLSVLANSMDGWEEKSDAVEKSMAEKIAATERQLEEKIESLDDKLDQSVDRIEDAIENEISGKLNLLDLKQSTCGGQESQATSEVEDGEILVLSNLTALGEELRSGQQDALERLSSSCLRMDKILNDTAELVSLIQSNLSQAKPNENQDSLIVSDLREDLTAVSSAQNASNSQLMKFLQGLQEMTNTGFESIEDVIFSVAAKSQFEISGLLTDLKHQLPINLTCTVADGDKDELKSCKKGISPVSDEVTFPYPKINPNEASDLDVPYLCDTSTDGGGWIIIQRRATGETNFTRDWESYKQGFGTLCSDFWLGNDNIHTLTSKGTWELRVDIKYKDKSAYAHYASFSIGSEADKYKLSVKTCDGTAGDSLAYHNNMKFSTYDQDNDRKSSGTPCSVQEHGGWWFNNCDFSNLNGKWGADSDYGIEWTSYIREVGMTFSEMKIRQAE